MTAKARSRSQNDLIPIEKRAVQGWQWCGKGGRKGGDNNNKEGSLPPPPGAAAAAACVHASTQRACLLRCRRHASAAASATSPPATPPPASAAMPQRVCAARQRAGIATAYVSRQNGEVNMPLPPPPPRRHAAILRHASRQANVAGYQLAEMLITICSRRALLYGHAALRHAKCRRRLPPFMPFHQAA